MRRRNASKLTRIPMREWYRFHLVHLPSLGITRNLLPIVLNMSQPGLSRRLNRAAVAAKKRGEPDMMIMANDTWEGMLNRIEAYLKVNFIQPVLPVDEDDPICSDLLGQSTLCQEVRSFNDNLVYVEPPFQFDIPGEDETAFRRKLVKATINAIESKTSPV